MNLGEVRDAVLAHVSRGISSVQVGGINLADQAIKNAVLSVERKIDLEWSKKEVCVSCSPTGNLLTDTVDANDETVKVKKVLYALAGSGSFRTIPYVSKTGLIADQSGQDRFVINPASESRHSDTSGYQKAVVHDGQTLSLFPRPTEDYNLYLYAVTYLPTLSQPSDTNFILEYGYDYIIYKAVHNLNYFLKEDQRFNVSAAVLQEALDSFDCWNSELVSPTEQETNL